MVSILELDGCRGVVHLVEIDVSSILLLDYLHLKAKSNSPAQNNDFLIGWSDLRPIVYLRVGYLFNSSFNADFYAFDGSFVIDLT